jgi:hypothetical protein
MVVTLAAVRSRAVSPSLRLLLSSRATRRGSLATVLGWAELVGFIRPIASSSPNDEGKPIAAGHGAGSCKV